MTHAQFPTPGDDALTVAVGRQAQTPHAGRPALDQVLDLLQGIAQPSLADPGLTCLPVDHLQDLHALALRQAEHCRDGLVLMVELWMEVLDHGTSVHAGLARRIASQVHLQLDAQQRWHALADNAAYYRDHAHVAERIADGLRRERA